MTDKYLGIKSLPRNVFLITGDNINKFGFSDPANPKAGFDFLLDCETMGWPSLVVDRDVYVFATRRTAQ